MRKNVRTRIIIRQLKGSGHRDGNWGYEVLVYNCCSSSWVERTVEREDDTDTLHQTQQSTPKTQDMLGPSDRVQHYCCTFVPGKRQAEIHREAKSWGSF